MPADARNREAWLARLDRPDRAVDRRSALSTELQAGEVVSFDLPWLPEYV